MRDRLVDLIAAEIPDDIPVDRLPDVDAIVERLLDAGVIVPPCKVGDTVYFLDMKRPCFACHEVTDYCHKNCRFVDRKSLVVKKATVVEFSIEKEFRKMFTRTDSEKGISSYHHTFWFQDMGKTVFLTKEQAEKALAERREG